MDLQQLKLKIAKAKKIAHMAITCDGVTDDDYRDEVDYAYNLMCEMEDIIRNEEINHYFDNREIK